MNVAGISAHFHDAAACVLVDGHLVAAAQEERFSRRKHDPSLPKAAFRYCLEEAGLTIADLDAVAYHEDPVAKLDRQLWSALPQVPSLAPEALFRLDAMRPEREIRELLGWAGPIHFARHHESHAASAFYFSGFREAALLTVDAVGEWATTSYGRAEGTSLELFEEVRFPDSLRPPESELDEFAADVARSLQAVLEEVLLAKVRYLHARAPSRNLCLAGGVALNCVAVERIAREGPFESVFVQPAAGDAGGALGAAALAHVRLTGQRPSAEPLRHLYLGPSFASAAVADLFEPGSGAQDFRGRESDLLEATVDRLAAGRVVGWFQGRMEFGPRALGNRSILADPRDPGMRERVNALVKKREAFRPFAPAVLASKAGDHFAIDRPTPFMVETCRVRSRLALPAVTHVDGSARVQTVDAGTNPRFHGLLQAFERRTGCPVLLNTSFSLRGEPIVCRPVDAVLCFLRSGLDCLVVEDHLLDRSAVRPSWLRWFGQAGPALAVPDSVYTLL